MARNLFPAYAAASDRQRFEAGEGSGMATGKLHGDCYSGSMQCWHGDFVCCYFVREIKGKCLFFKGFDLDC
ncbi:MAG TPA: hypothetical protein EYH51_14665 [Pseudomonas pachastrellae]|nr:hypothetical protein [Halopseudomonas pachastrellae]